MAELLSKNDNRREKLKNIIYKLHEGVPVNEVKDTFKELINDITPSELAAIENDIIEEGLPAEEVKRLCDVHVAVFKESLEAKPAPDMITGHPVQVFKYENRAIERTVAEIELVLEKIKLEPSDELFLAWKEKHGLLMDIEKHFLRKENLMFPIMEKHGFTGPSKVMWALHDDIRAEMKDITSLLSSNDITADAIDQKVIPALQMITDMIYKEEKVLLPASIEKLDEEEWIAIAQQSLDIGYSIVAPEKDWEMAGISSDKTGEIPSNKIRLSTGNLALEQIELLFSHLPVDITFVDEKDIVAFFSAGPDRVFHRTKAIIGRKVQNCHPPKSVHVVERILDEFKSNKRNVAEFWLELNGKFVHIRYFAIRDDKGNYRGTLEVTQDITAIRKLEGSKRIHDPLKEH